MLMQDLNKTIPDIVRLDYRTAEVFKKYGINYWCEEEISLLEICTLKGLDYNAILEELAKATKTITISNSLHFSEWKISFLIDYIINVHHAYMHMAIPSIDTSLNLFMVSHKNKYAETSKIPFLFHELSLLLMTHSRHEEEIIFPYIRQIESTHRRRETYGNLFVRTLRKPLSNIEKEHEEIMSVLKKIEMLTNEYTSWPGASIDQIALYSKLKEFHADMEQHTYLEDCILYPKAITLEEELLQL
jgi:regulator of cell morphogenesis and NO signaling